MHTASHRLMKTRPATRVVAATLLALGMAQLAMPARAQAVAKTTGTAWVANEKDNTLTQLDTQTWAVLATISTCQRPRHVQAYKTERLYVACSSANQIDIIDPATGKSLGRLPGGDDPELFDISADGKKIYISAEDKGDMITVDVAKAQVVQHTPVGAEPEGVLASPDGQRVYVASEAGNHVAVVDVARNIVIKTIPVGKRARRLALAAQGKELWVSNELDGTLSVIDTTTLAVLHTLVIPKDTLPSPPLPAGMVTSPDGRTVYVALGRANHVAVVDVASRTVRGLVPVGKRVWGVNLNRAGTVLLAAGGLSDDVTVVDTATLKVIQTVRVGKAPQSIAFIE